MCIISFVLLHISASITMSQKIGPCAVGLSLIRIIKADLLSLCSGYISVKIYVARKNRPLTRHNMAKVWKGPSWEISIFFDLRKKKKKNIYRQTASILVWIKFLWHWLN